jgi:hypothetical protein
MSKTHDDGLRDLHRICVQMVSYNDIGSDRQLLCLCSPLLEGQVAQGLAINWKISTCAGLSRGLF